jgi:hypothetical protein
LLTQMQPYECIRQPGEARSRVSMSSPEYVHRPEGLLRRKLSFRSQLRLRASVDPVSDRFEFIAICYARGTIDRRDTTEIGIIRPPLRCIMEHAPAIVIDEAFGRSVLRKEDVVSVDLHVEVFDLL